MRLRVLITAAATAVMVSVGGPAWADAFQDGVSALQAGQYAVALDAWQKPAEAGDARCQYGLGYLYQFGLGTDPDNAQATAWYQKAAAQHYPDALYALGLMWESGRAGKQDRAKALILYREAATTGKSPSAEYAIGRIYIRGDGVPRDEKEGLIWLSKAAQDGQPAAQYMLGAAYEVGTVVKASKIEAYYWYSAALNGDQAVLHGTDPEFDPKAALSALTERMSRWEIEDAKAKLKKDPPPQGPAPQTAKPAQPAKAASSGTKG
jgi:TPR repeat protein